MFQPTQCIGLKPTAYTRLKPKISEQAKAQYENYCRCWAKAYVLLIYLWAKAQHKKYIGWA